MKKFGIISVCILVVLIFLYVTTSMGLKSSYDNEENLSPEGEEIVSTTESETKDIGVSDVVNTDNETTGNETTNLVIEEKSETEIDENTSLAGVTPETPETPEEINSGEDYTVPADRTIYADGFYYEPLSEEIKEKITGVSYHENDNITYDDLRYLSVLYVDFDGNTQTGEIICNQAIAQDLVEIFKELYDNAYEIDKIRLIDEYGGDDDLSCDDNNTSCFNYRVVGGTDTLSKHALGLAIDINPFQNPYITYPNGVERISPVGSEPYADRDSGLAHMILEGDLCYNLFIEHGFTWGGHWKTLKDYQHFQKAL